MINVFRVFRVLIVIDIKNVLIRSIEIKVIIVEECVDIDDGVLDNYSFFDLMGEEINDK